MPEVQFTTEPHGLRRFARLMRQAGMIEEVSGSWEEFIYDNLNNADGN